MPDQMASVESVPAGAKSESTEIFKSSSEVTKSREASASVGLNFGVGSCSASTSVKSTQKTMESSSSQVSETKQFISAFRYSVCIKGRLHRLQIRLSSMSLHCGAWKSKHLLAYVFFF